MIILAYVIFTTGQKKDDLDELDTYYSKLKYDSNAFSGNARKTQFLETRFHAIKVGMYPYFE